MTKSEPRGSLVLVLQRSADPRSLSASVLIEASPRAVWVVVADVRRTGEWSPECGSVTPIGPLRRGCLLFGVNRRGRTRWVTLSRVRSLDAEREIAWVVLTNRSVWTYRLAPDGAGTRLTETRETPRGESRFAVWFTERFLGGQTGHDNELEAGMYTGLMRIKQLVEGGRQE